METISATPSAGYVCAAVAVEEQCSTVQWDEPIRRYSMRL